jgi:putative transposase
MSSTEKRQLVVSSHPRLSLKKQCEILGVSRSLMYYKPKGESAGSVALILTLSKS